MKQQITWEETKGDTINGFGIKINYLFTSFDPNEIRQLEDWCKKHIKAGLLLKDVRIREDLL